MLANTEFAILRSRNAGYLRIIKLKNARWKKILKPHKIWLTIPAAAARYVCDRIVNEDVDLIDLADIESLEVRRRENQKTLFRLSIIQFLLLGGLILNLFDIDTKVYIGPLDLTALAHFREPIFLSSAFLSLYLSLLGLAGNYYREIISAYFEAKKSWIDGEIRSIRFGSLFDNLTKMIIPRTDTLWAPEWYYNFLLALVYGIGGILALGVILGTWALQVFLIIEIWTDPTVPLLLNRVILLVCALVLINANIINIFNLAKFPYVDAKALSKTIDETSVSD